jgi:hypothetical protein
MWWRIFGGDFSLIQPLKNVKKRGENKKIQIVKKMLKSFGLNLNVYFLL